MRVCPKCGHVDPPYWKHVKFSYFIDSCSLENFKVLHPELAKTIVKDKLVEDDNYIYRLCRNGIWVQRKAKVDYGDKSFSDKCEKHDPRLKWKWHGKRSTKGVKALIDFYPVWFKLSPKQKKLALKR